MLTDKQIFLADYAKGKGWMKDGDTITIMYDDTTSTIKTNIPELNDIAEQALKNSEKSR